MTAIDTLFPNQVIVNNRRLKMANTKKLEKPNVFQRLNKLEEEVCILKVHLNAALDALKAMQEDTVLDQDD